jgi:3',5'-nucleoside bisphosphate phosphatase
MRTRPAPLLCELHAHTTGSDGAVPLPDLVDTYGARGFDVLCVTDHSCRADDPWLSGDERGPRAVHAANHAEYLAEIAREATRARERYDLLLVPGLELTWNDLDPLRAAHALALGLRSFVSIDDGLETALAETR